MTTIFAPAPSDATGPADATSQTGRNRRDTDGPGASAVNAFATTLATAMHPHAALHAPKARTDDANSELDAHDSRATGKIGRAHNSASPESGATATASRTAAGSTSSTPASSLMAPDMTSNITDGASGVGMEARKAMPAFAAAAEARAAAANAPVTSPNADADALNPDFRTRLARVASRMHDEFGKDIQLVEGFRTQSRQDFLYDQGRTRAGDVVTWTRSSRHTLGLAADVMIDGSYTDSAGYQQLARLAAQEGLRTLGPKDPGHIELPTHGGAAAWGSSADVLNIDDNVSRAVGIALDQGSTDGNSPGDNDGVGNFNGLLSRIGRSSATSAPPIQMPMMAGTGSGGGSMFSNFSQYSNGGTDRDDSKPADTAQIADVASVANVAQVAQVAQVAHMATVMQPQVAIPGAVVSATAVPMPGTDAAEKVGRMLDVRDAAPVAPLSHMTVNIDNGTGGADSITVQLRGGVVDTAISLGDPNRADRMSLRTGELQHALQQHGLDATRINVASTNAGSGPGWNPRQGSDQSGQNGRPSLNYRDSRQDADATRQRSRREQQGGRQR